MPSNTTKNALKNKIIQEKALTLWHETIQSPAVIHTVNKLTTNDGENVAFCPGILCPKGNVLSDGRQGMIKYARGAKHRDHIFNSLGGQLKLIDETSGVEW